MKKKPENESRKTTTAKGNFDMDKIDSRLSSLYSSDIGKQQTYDQWAGKYETDLVDDMGYVAHIDAAAVFSELVPERNCRILDVACGTGLVARELVKLGYQHIDGTDFSQGMLDESGQLNIYQNLFQHDFTQPLSNTQQYDALICVGLFSFRMPKITDMIYVIRAVKPGGYCIITVNGAAWSELDLEPVVRAEAERHGFVIEHIRQAGYIQNQGIDSRILVIRSPQ